MKFLKNIILLLLVVFIIAAVYLATLDGSYEVSRTRLIKADREVVFNDLNDYRNWKDWGPWYEQDSTIRVQYADNTIGEGGAYTWTSEVEGGGSIKTVEVDKPEKIKQEIIFETPFGDMKSEIYWNLNSEGSSDTELTWGMKGELPFFSRFMASGMEDQLGPMQERGLELFDENIQRKLKIYSIDSLGVVDFSGGFYLYLSTSSKIDQMNPKLEGMMRKIEKFVANNRIRVTGSPYTIYHKFDQENGTTMFSVAFPVQERIITTDSDILTGFMERGTYFKIVLKGSYNNLEEAWQKAMFDAANLQNHTLQDGGEPFEIYVNSPENTRDPSKLITEIYIPVKMK